MVNLELFFFLESLTGAAGLITFLDISVYLLEDLRINVMFSVTYLLLP